MVYSLVDVQKCCSMKKNSGSCRSYALIPLKPSVLFLNFFPGCVGLHVYLRYPSIVILFSWKCSVVQLYDDTKSTGRFSCRQSSYLDGSCNLVESIFKKRYCNRQAGTCDTVINEMHCNKVSTVYGWCGLWKCASSKHLTHMKYSLVYFLLALVT